MKDLLVGELKDKKLIYDLVEIDCIDGASREEELHIRSNLNKVLDNLMVVEVLYNLDTDYITDQLTNNKEIQVYYNTDITNKAITELNKALISDIKPRLYTRSKEVNTIKIKDYVIIEAERKRRSQSKKYKNEILTEITVIKNGVNITSALFDYNLIYTELKQGYLLLLKKDIDQFLYKDMIVHIEKSL